MSANSGVSHKAGVRRATERDPATNSQVDEVGLEGGEEELGVLTASAGEERVLHEGGGLLVQLVLEAEEALLAVDIGPGAAEATTEGEEEGI